MERTETKKPILGSEAPSTTWLDFFIKSSAALSFFLGLIVLVGWILKSPTLVQVMPAFAPMQANTAVAFAISGVSFLAALHRYKKFSISGAILISLLGLLTLAQYLLQIDLQIDQLLITPFVTTKTSHPGRMSPIGAICFFLTGLALFLISLLRKRPLLPLLLSIIGSTLLAAGTSSIFGYLTDRTMLYGWGYRLTEVAVHSAIGYCFLGATVLAYAWKETQSIERAFPRWIPIPIGLGILAGTISLYLSTVSAHRAQAERSVQIQANVVADFIANEFKERINALIRMAMRWQMRSGMPQVEWEGDALSYVQHYPGFRSLICIDSYNRMRWSAQPQSTPALQPLEFLSEPKFREAILNARNRNGAYVSPALNHEKLGKFALIVVPLYARNRFDGTVIAVIQFEQIVRSLLSDDVASNYGVAIRHNRSLIYRTIQPAVTPAEQIQCVANTSFFGTEWQVELTTIEVESAVSSVVGLVVGVLLAAFTSGAVYFAQTARRKAQEAANTSKSLTVEISERRRAQKSLQEITLLQRAILDGANYSIISTTPDGIIHTFNAAAERMLGYKASEVVGVLTPMILHDPEEVADRAVELSNELGTPIDPGFEVFVARAKRNESEEREWTYVRKDGNRFPVLLSITPLHNEQGEISGFLAVGQDITERKQFEQELASARDAALESARLKSAFLANMSHEVRTPMNGIIGMTDLLLDTPLNPQQQEYAQTVRNCSESLLAIVNDILDFSKIEAGKLKLEILDFDLREELQSAIKLLAEAAHAKGLELKVVLDAGMPSALRGDPVRFKQVLTNLVSNAIKFTSHGRVTVRATKIEESATHVIMRLEVQDSGIGISPEILPTLFQPFTQGDVSTSRKFGGTGLGLAISSQLIEMMNGLIGVESTPGKGSLFWFNLPFEKQKQKGTTESKTTLAERTKNSLIQLEAQRRMPRILLAEDNLVNQQVALGQLRRLGLPADVVSNGREAVNALEGQIYDIVLMDCQMPEVDGYEATRLIRELEAGGTRPRTRIIALTAHALQGDRDKCLAAGMDDYLSKPFNASELKAALERAEISNSTKTVAIFERDSIQAAEPLPPLNLNHLKEIVSGDENQLRDLIQLYLRESAIQIRQLKAAFDQGSSEEVEIWAHKLKGGSATCGMIRLSDLLSRLEQAGRTNTLSTTRSLLQQVLAEHERVNVYLQSQIADASEGNAKGDYVQ